MSEELTAMVIEDATEKMGKVIERVKHEFAGVRTGRATPTLVENLHFDYQGTTVSLKQMAGFSVPEARLLVISPYDKSAIPAIEKAIQNSDIGLSASNDGVVLRLSFPPLTEERRKALVKVVHTKAEEGKVALRNVRRQARHDLESLEKDEGLSSDDTERAEKILDKLTHGEVEAIDALLAQKEQELLEV